MQKTIAAVQKGMSEATHPSPQNPRLLTKEEFDNRNLPIEYDTHFPDSLSNVYGIIVGGVKYINTKAK